MSKKHPPQPATWCRACNNFTVDCLHKGTSAPASAVKPKSDKSKGKKK